MGIESKTDDVEHVTGIVEYRIDEFTYLVNPNFGSDQILTNQQLVPVNIWQMFPTFPNSFPKNLSTPHIFDWNFSKEETCSRPDCNNHECCGLHSCFKCKRDYQITDENGIYLHILKRGGVCWLCNNRTICGSCLEACRSQQQIIPLRTVTAGPAGGEPRRYWLEIWCCPACLFVLEQECLEDLSFADVVSLIFEKLASPGNPVCVTTQFSKRGDIFLGQAELFALLTAFGGCQYLLSNGQELLHCFQGLSAILGKSFRTTDVKLLKDIITNQFLNAEWFLSPAIKVSKHFRKGLLVKTLLGKVQCRLVKGMRTRTFRHTFKKQPQNEAPTIKDHLNLSWGHRLQVCCIL